VKRWLYTLWQFLGVVWRPFERRGSMIPEPYRCTWRWDVRSAWAFAQILTDPTNPYAEGAEAWQQGKTYNDNPYLNGTLEDGMWTAGFENGAENPAPKVEAPR